MTFLLLQAFLLMTAAYFLGAFIGCWWRRTFYTPVETRTIVTAEPAIAGAGMAGAGALNVPRSDPVPVQPRIEYVDTPDAAADRHRFERALSGVGRLEENAAATAPEPQPPVSMPPVTEAAPHFEVVPRATAPAPAPAEPPPAKPDMAAIRETDDAVAAAAAAAAAAMTIAARTRAAAAAPAAEPPAPRPVPVAPPPAAPEPVQPAPSAVARPVAASGGMAGVAADVRTPPLVPADGQDLTLIAGIDEATERTLHSLGVWRYADIAKWTAGDVTSVNSALGTRGRVQRQNWIEQAAVLAKGSHTLYARRRLRGEFVSASPTDTARPARGPMPGPGATPQRDATASATIPRAPQASAAAAAAATAAAAAAASRGLAAAPGARPLSPVRAPRPLITEIAEPRQPAPAPPQPAPAPAPIAAPPAAPVAATPSASPSRQGQSLQRIRGIDQAVERTLNEHDITRYEDIAGWTATEVDYFNELLGAPGRVSRQNWIEQAQVLARGSTTLYARQHDAGHMQIPGGAAAVAAAAAASAAAPPELRPRPSRLADAMRQNSGRTAEPSPRPAEPPAQTSPVHAASEPAPTPSPEPVASAPAAQAPAVPAAAPAPARNDVSGLRSVRSEALRSDRFPMSGVTDDLKRIRGIGVLIEKKLNSLGISSYDQIANWTAADIAHVSEVLDFRGRIERENWVEQSRILSAGGQTEFSRRVDRGEIN